MAPDPPEPTTAVPDRAVDPEPSTPPGTSGARWLAELAVVLVLVIGATVVLRMFVVQTFSIPSGSMLPTLQIGDRIVVDKADFHIHRGDVVVFRRPPLEEQDYADLVKRVIGLPGETISSSGGHILIDGKVLQEPWLPAGPDAYTGALNEPDPHPQFDLPGPVRIPAGDYFVMGDNRTESEDSRFFGPIPRSLIVGRAVLVAWPLGQVKGL